ncbi:hypothetical protein [Patulibacter minatonensis]|uniref:hypothetical protein n=1 Tax=Patulibacter minatonensis TaxID=298163 RepID=UPI00047894E4|nr:hypothetical protein [Patulibacter minatonensis]
MSTDRIWLHETHGATVKVAGQLRPYGHDGEPVEYVRADILGGVQHQALELGHELVKERKAVEAERDRYRRALVEIERTFGDPRQKQYPDEIARQALDGPATTDAQEGTTP